MLYVCEKNGLSYLLKDRKVEHDASGPVENTFQNSKRLRALVNILKTKQDNIHTEGLAHAVYALSKIGYEDEALWSTLAKQISARDEGHFNVVYLKAHNGNPSHFQYASGIKSFGPSDEHMEQSNYNTSVQSLFFEDRVHLFELKEGLQGAQQISGSASSDVQASLDKLNGVLGKLDGSNDMEQLMLEVNQIYRGRISSPDGFKPPKVEAEKQGQIE